MTKVNFMEPFPLKFNRNSIVLFKTNTHTCESFMSQLKNEENYNNNEKE